MKLARFSLSPIAVRPHRWLALLPWLATASLPAPAEAAESTDEPESKRGGFVFSLLPKSLQRNPRLDLNVITEMTPDGKKLPLPTAATPVYYMTIPGGYMKVGQAPPAGEKAPPVADLERVMQRALAQNHYLPGVVPAHPPTLALVYHWGSHNNLAEDTQTAADQMRIVDAAQSVSSGGLPSQEAATAEAAASLGGKPPPEFSAVFAIDQLKYALSDPVKRRDLLERAALIGGIKFARELEQTLEEQVHYSTTYAKPRPPPKGNSLLAESTPEPKVPGGPIMGDAAGEFVDPASPFERFRRRNPQVEHLVEESFSTCYFVIASAYDGRELAQGRRRLLWRTKMTVNGDGVALKDTLPTLVITAGKYLGRDMDGAATISRRLLRTGEVEVGTPTVVEFPAANSSAVPKKSEKKP